MLAAHAVVPGDVHELPAVLAERVEPVMELSRVDLFLPKAHEAVLVSSVRYSHSGAAGFMSGEASVSGTALDGSKAVTSASLSPFVAVA